MIKRFDKKNGLAKGTPERVIIDRKNNAEKSTSFDTAIDHAGILLKVDYDF